MFCVRNVVSNYITFIFRKNGQKTCEFGYSSPVGVTSFLLCFKNRRRTRLYLTQQQCVGSCN